MRYALCIGSVFIAAAVLSVPEAKAQFSYSGEGECNKGLFWPFVRNPGDCLTDAERRSGMTGTYRESEIEETDGDAEAATPAPAPTQAQQSAPPAENTAPAAPAAASSPSQTETPAVATSPAPTAPATPTTPTPAAPAAGTAAVQPAAAQSAAPVVESASQEPALEDDRTTYTGPSGCTKGIFWPFVRRPGDCLTDAEIRSGMTGTYQ